MALHVLAHQHGSSEEELLREQLADYVNGRTRFPSQSEFKTDGKGRLLGPLARTGGSRRWAAEFGLPLAGSGPRDAWTEERVREELATFLDGRTDWPAHREFEGAGRGSLYDAMTRLGGVRRWRLRFGYGGAPLRWTDERVRSKLAEFLDGRDRWPAQREFVEAGKKGLLDAIYKNGGPNRWAKEFGLTVRAKNEQRQWTDERISAELRAFLAERDRWPTEREMKASGRQDLLVAIRRYGGRAKWKRRAGREGWIPE